MWLVRPAAYYLMPTTSPRPHRVTLQCTTCTTVEVVLVWVRAEGDRVSEAEKSLAELEECKAPHPVSEEAESR